LSRRGEVSSTDVDEMILLLDTIKEKFLRYKVNSFLDVNRNVDMSNINIDFWMKLNWIFA
jgi:hypothetical protein